MFRQLLTTKSLAISLCYHFFTTGWMVKEFFQGCGWMLGLSGHWSSLSKPGFLEKERRDWGICVYQTHAFLLLCLPFQLLSNQSPAEVNPASTRAACSSRVCCACSLLTVAIVAWSPDCPHCALEHSSVDGGGGRHGKNHGPLIILLPTKTFCAFF